MPPNEGNDRRGAWPELPLDAWRDTKDTLHMWAQIVGKTRLARSPPLNHWWHSALYVTACGLSTGPMPEGDRLFEVEIDLVEHVLRASTTDGRRMAMPLVPCSVRSFYAEYMSMMRALGIELRIWTMPVEIANPIPFEEDVVHASYDAHWAHQFWEVLRRADAVLREFASGFVGKQSPVHFFWGSFDLASTRFSGRRAPERPGADRVTREAYSHEVVSFGFWPGGTAAGGVVVDVPVFYAYAAPEPEGFRASDVRPTPARYDPRLSEFILPYEEIRRTPDPRAGVLAFYASVYEAEASLARWDPDLERTPDPPTGPGADRQSAERN
jgi:hypothetical protein